MGGDKDGCFDIAETGYLYFYMDTEEFYQRNYHFQITLKTQTAFKAVVSAFE